jgi:hypothetical protein
MCDLRSADYNTTPSTLAKKTQLFGGAMGSAYVPIVVSVVDLDGVPQGSVLTDGRL